ncbi:sulfite exporter TauE/SafE family protein [Oerskovia enterophila]|uniref:sulfite exporter TauE/SafE family protein n=1 Tax=Oerskovia enterophila TaxID=43678 RepID=UPI003396922B
MFLVLLLSGCLTGVTTVLFGFGGGFMIVPLLLWFLSGPGSAPLAEDMGMHVAVATSSAVMVVNAGVATFAQHRAGTLRTDALWPLTAFIAFGAALGASVAGLVPSEALRWAFVVYLAVTLLNAVLRPGFLATARPARPLGRATTFVVGPAVGAVAALLGVGGSVMTVPLFRRHGWSMTDSAGLANPLGLPVAVAASITYVVAGGASASVLGAGHLGYVDLSAFVGLAVGSVLGIVLTRRFVGRMPDRVHARAYLVLLAVVLVATVVA